MGMFSRAHSGNLAVLREAINRWSHEDHLAQVQSWFDPLRNKHRVVVKVIHYRTKLVLVQKDFSDCPMICDEDVMTVTVGSWLNKQYNDYKQWK